MTEIVTPFAQFFDTSGVPLNNGAIFIGTAYLDAQTNPIPVYWDDALTIPAAQPIRTLNGYAVRNGAPARIFCNADNFSMTVQTSTGRTVWAVQDATSVPTLSNAQGSDQVGFIAAGPSAVARTVQNKLRDVVSVKDFGAVGDGVADDGPAIRAAIDSNREVYFPPGTYQITSPCVFANKSNVKLRGAGRASSRIRCASGAVFTNSAIVFVDCSGVQIEHLTLDQNNNPSFTAFAPLLHVITSSFVTLSECNVVNLTYIGCGFNQVSDFQIVHNFMEHNTAVNSTNYNINITSTIPNPSSRGIIRNNVLLRSSNIFSGRDLVIDGNVALGSKYGANIATQGNASLTYGNYVVTNNICNSASGIDSDGFHVDGMEIDGISAVVANNICNQNGGVGIGVLARNSVISNNICLGNGQNPTAPDADRVGILMGYSDAVLGAHYCIVSGNRCGDDGSGRQKYGYYEQGSAINNTALMANNFAGNVTAETFIQSSSGFYETNTWASWTPTISSTVGTLGTIGAVTAKYRLEGKTLYFIISVTITANGTGAGAINIGVPPIFGGVNGNQVCSGRENGLTGKALVGWILTGPQGIYVTNYDTSYPGGNGAVIALQGFYEVA
jgi:hypothetical protein